MPLVLPATKVGHSVPQTAHPYGGLTERAFSLIACGGSNTGTGDSNPVSGFPLTVENCGQRVTIEKTPERVMLIYRYAAPLVEAAGALDKVVVKAGNYPSELYAEQTGSTLERIPTIGGAETSDGSVQAAATQGTAPRTAAAVFVPVGGGQLYTTAPRAW